MTAFSDYKNVSPVELPITLRKDVSGVVTDLMVKTVTDQVYSGDETLTEILNAMNLEISLKADESEFQELRLQFNKLVADMPEAYDTIKKIADYIEAHKVEYTNVLNELNNRVKVEEGKGLSTNDFTNEYKQKLTDLYTRTELENLFQEVNTTIETLSADAISYTSEGEGKPKTNVSEALHNLEKGQFTCVETVDEMNKIIGTPQAKPGMFVYVRDGDGKTYQLNDEGTEFLWFNNGVITPKMLTQILEYIDDKYEASTIYNEDGVSYLLIK